MAKAIAIGALALLLVLCGLAGPAWSDGSAMCKLSGLELDMKTASDAKVDLVPVTTAPAAEGTSPPTQRVLMEDALQQAIEHIAAPIEPADIRPFAAPHPYFRTAAGSITLPHGQVVVVAIGSPGGPLLARFVKTSGPATPQELTSFRRAVAGLRFAPGSYCTGRALPAKATHGSS